MRVRLWEPFTLESPLGDLKLALKRMSVEEYSSFMEGMAASFSGPKSRLGERVTDEEREKDEEGKFVISSAEIIVRRVKDLPSSEREELEEQSREYEHATAEFFREMCVKYVRLVDPIELEDFDGTLTKTTNSEDLGVVFGGSSAVFFQIMMAINSANSLSTAEKNGSGSQSSSITSLLVPKTAQAGETPDEVVTSVETKDSAVSGGA